jgi:hypothetical protein
MPTARARSRVSRPSCQHLFRHRLKAQDRGQSPYLLCWRRAGFYQARSRFEQLLSEVSEALGDKLAILLRGNGQVTAGGTVPEPVMMAIDLEEAEILRCRCKSAHRLL